MFTNDSQVEHFSAQQHTAVCALNATTSDNAWGGWYCLQWSRQHLRLIYTQFSYRQIGYKIECIILFWFANSYKELA